MMAQIDNFSNLTREGLINSTDYNIYHHDLNKYHSEELSMNAMNT